LEELAESLGPDLCRDNLMYEFISMQDDPVFKVRREMVTKLVRISKVLGDNIFTPVIIPLFKKLS